MALWDKFTGELVDIIEWTDDSSNTIVHRFERHNNEIKYGAKLVVRQAQTAVFVNQGQIADVFSPGTYELTTENIPFLTTLKGWKYGFQSPFKAEIYFVNTQNFTDLKWGTKNPIMLRDKEFGAVRLRAFGSYVVRVADAAKILKQIVGTDGVFTTDEITDQLRNLIVSRFADILAESGIPVLDLAANYDELSDFVSSKIGPEFNEYGLELTKFLTENISLPPKVEEALDKRSSMGIVGNLQQYTQFQTANAMEQAAQNPGGGASAGVGMGMGFGMANQMAENQMQKTQQTGSSQQASPPPLPTEYYIGEDGQQKGPYDLKTLQDMIRQGNVNRETYIWKQGMENWAHAGDVEDFRDQFGATPPPLPEE